MRLNLDIRRHWKCPVCGAERRLPATVTTVRCGCSGGPMMRLVESLRRNREISQAPSGVLEFDLSQDPVTIPENLPVPNPNNRPGRGPRPRRGGPPEAPPPPANETSERSDPPRQKGPKGKGTPKAAPPEQPPTAEAEAPADDFGAGLDAAPPSETTLGDSNPETN